MKLNEIINVGPLSLNQGDKIYFIFNEKLISGKILYYYGAIDKYVVKYKDNRQMGIKPCDIYTELKYAKRELFLHKLKGR